MVDTVSVAAGSAVYGPDNPPRLRKPGESVDEYRVAMGWSGRGLNSIVFKYTGACVEIHRVSVGIHEDVIAVGDPDSAAYEWVVVRGDEVLSHSDVAYGSPAVALRDGLIEYFGLPGM